MRSAVSLTDDERQRLTATLTKTLQAGQVVLDRVVKPTLLGGVLVENGTIVLDGSLRGQLDAIRRRLAYGTR
jgi:F-type H+-transporting ATPase subunit delta